MLDRPYTKLIAALDVSSEEDAVDLAKSLIGATQWVKVGLELFTSAGPAAMTALRALECKIMLDLKLKDIPETVARAVQRGCDMGAEMLTLHASGGPKMMEAAQKAASKFPGVTLLAVTVLTSLDHEDLRRMGLSETPAQHAMRLANLARESGIQGIVCSTHEVRALKTEFPKLTYVVPGIRPSGGDTNDQKRVATPALARSEGADFIVVGRPIRDATDRKAMAKSILQEMGTPALSLSEMEQRYKEMCDSERW